MLVSLMHKWELMGVDHLKIRMFPLSLSGTAFSWFSALAPNSVQTWSQLERKFHDHFYNGEK